MCGKKMGSSQTLVCVKQVKQDAAEEWEESMPLPGDIIEGVAVDESDESFVPAKGRSDLSSQLGKLNKLRQGENQSSVWIKVRRGETALKLQARVVQERGSKLQRRFTIQAVSDDRHVAVLADLTLEQCTELQEMSRKVVNMDDTGYTQKVMKYNWKKKVGMFLPDRQSTVISSILFMPLAGEYNVGSTTARSMAWFSSAVSSGAPLIFVNIQTEQVVATSKDKSIAAGREMRWGRQQTYNTTIQIVQGIRLWFLPGVAEVPIVLTPEKGESRFGMDIIRTEEGFICIYKVAQGSAADRAGLGELQEQAKETGHLVLISELEGKSLLPSMASSIGLIHCCDNIQVKETLSSAIDRMEGIHLHIMSWPNNHTKSPHDATAFLNTLMPPTEAFSTTTTFYSRSNSDRFLDQELSSSGYFT